MMIRKNFCKTLLALAFSATSLSSVYAQGVFEGSGEESNGNPSCVGDGCGIEPEISTQEELSQTEETDGNQAEVSDENTPNEVQVSDSLSQVEQVQADSIQNPEEQITPLDGEEDSRDHYVSETASEFRARKEGFSRRIQFGVRVGGALNVPFGDSDGWNMGFGFGGGISARLPLTYTGLGLAAGIEFGYRRFNYEDKTDYSKDEATLSQMLFEIPLTLQYALDEDGFFLGAGANLQLKMQGESEFTQKISTDEVQAKDKRNNTLPTSGVEIGVTGILGYNITNWCQADLRATFNFTNLLDPDVTAESTLMDSKLHMLYINAGITFLL